MVQIKLGDTKKEPLGKNDTVVDVDNEVKETKGVPVGTYRIIRRTSSSQIGWFPVFSFFVILVSSFCLLKQVCDLKQENLILRRQLELESQKDAILKQVVTDAAVSEKMFMRSGRRMSRDMNLIISAPVKDPSNWLDINLSLLWSSPEISRCEMASVARMLFEEIYKHGEQIYEEKELEMLEEYEEAEQLLQEAEDELAIEDEIEEADSAEISADSIEPVVSEEIPEAPLL